jgi:phage FluMu protein Com
VELCKREILYSLRQDFTLAQNAGVRQWHKGNIVRLNVQLLLFKIPKEELTMIDFRCNNCNKLLGKIEGKAEIVCPRCKTLNKRPSFQDLITKVPFWKDGEDWSK